MTPMGDVSALADDASARRAVIDIGSNSVRLVVYDGPRRAPFAVCNEKALCGLGRDMTEDGRLNPDNAAFALATLTRFRRVLDDLKPDRVQAVATAAVRAAVDGADFVRKANALGFDIEIIDGAEEATLAAYGVMSYEPSASGIIGDMGGGSLELVHVNDADIRKSTSLPIGPLKLMQAHPEVSPGLKKAIDQSIGGVKWLAKSNAKKLYVVGGAWRALARLHMSLRDYPLSVLHHYEFTAKEAIELCEFVAKQSRQSLQNIPDVPRRRIDTLPYAALVLRSVVKTSGVDGLLVSAGGLREGTLFADLSPLERSQDPLLVGAQFLANRMAPMPAFGQKAGIATDGLFPTDTPAQARVRHAACRLVDIGAFFHPDLRALHAFESALRAPFYGVSHQERVIIASALYFRHEGLSAPSPNDRLTAILSPEERAYAERLGLALRFLSSYAPKSPQLLEHCALSREPGKIVFTMPTGGEQLFQELAKRRFDALAAAFEAEAEIAYVDAGLSDSPGDEVNAEDESAGVAG